MEEFNNWIAEQERHLKLNEQLQSAQEQNLTAQIRNNYAALLNFEEKNRLLGEYSKSLHITLSNKDSISRLLELTNSNQTIIKMTNTECPALPECDVENINMAKIQDINSRLLAATNKIEDASKRLNSIEIDRL